MERKSVWVSPERRLGDRSFTYCTRCDGPLFEDQSRSLDFSGTHPREVLCGECTENMHTTSQTGLSLNPMKNLHQTLNRADSSRPLSVRSLAISGLLLLFTLSLVAVKMSQAPAPPTPFEGIMDLALVFVPSQKGKYTVDQGYLAPYVSYLDKDGRSREWLFDSYLFLSLSSASKANFRGQSRKQDWQWWIDKLFAKEQQLDALNSQVSAAGKELGRPSKKGVIISIPYPDPKVTDFAHEDDSGERISFREPNGKPYLDARLDACQWFTDQVIKRWKMEQFRNLELIGFYWIREELFQGDKELVNALSPQLESRDLDLYWIPYNSEKNLEDLEEYRSGELLFDYVWIQPNHAFRDRVTGKWRERRDLDRIAEAAKDLGVSIEIELDPGRLLTGDMSAINNFYHYLDGGLFHLYMRKPLAYYVFPAEMYRSENSVVRQSYEVLGRFVKDRHHPVPQIIHLDASNRSSHSPIKMESGSWGSVDAVYDESCRLAPPGATISLQGVDNSKDYILAIRYLTYHPSAVTIKTRNGWKEVGRLEAEGAWKVGHWKLPLSGTRIKILEAQLTEVAWVSDIWIYTDETIFEMRDHELARARPGIYADRAGSNQTWQVGKNNPVIINNVDTRIPWVVAMEYRSGNGALIDVSNSFTVQFAEVEESQNWTTHAFTIPPHMGSSQILLSLDNSIEIRNAFLAPSSFLTNVGTSWDTNPLRHRPGTFLKSGWSAQRTDDSSPVITYRNGEPGAVAEIQSMLSENGVELTLSYRASEELIITLSNSRWDEQVLLPQSKEWTSYKVEIPPSSLDIDMVFSKSIDLDSLRLKPL